MSPRPSDVKAFTGCHHLLLVVDECDTTHYSTNPFCRCNSEAPYVLMSSWLARSFEEWDVLVHAVALDREMEVWAGVFSPPPCGSTLATDPSKYHRMQFLKKLTAGVYEKLWEDSHEAQMRINIEPCERNQLKESYELHEPLSLSLVCVSWCELWTRASIHRL